MPSKVNALFGKEFKITKMTNKVIVVTSPDDVLLDGFRILLVNLSPEQGKIVSDALLHLDTSNTVIMYMWNNDAVNWLLDKKTKSDLIIFNADSDNDILVGYLAAHPTAHYFGILKDLHQINNRAIYNVENVLTLLEEISKKHGKI